ISVSFSRTITANECQPRGSSDAYLASSPVTYVLPGAPKDRRLWPWSLSDNMVANSGIPDYYTLVLKERPFSTILILPRNVPARFCFLTSLRKIEHLAPRLNNLIQNRLPGRKDFGMEFSGTANDILFRSAGNR